MAFFHRHLAMDATPRFVLNRSAITLIPKQPVLDWLLAVDPGPPMDITLAELRQEQDVFLVPQHIEIPEAAERWVYRRWKMFMERFMFEWYMDETLWPSDRSLKMFKAWFDVQFSSMVWDLSDEPMVAEDWDDLPES